MKTTLKTQLKPKVCKQCGKEFQPYRPLQMCCDLTCAIKYSRPTKRNLARKRKEDKEKLMTRSDYLKRAQTAFNKFIRLRDKDLPCISCGRKDAVQWHAGHYRSVGACPELRFSEWNAAKQCSQCNDWKSGNIVEYRIRLIQRIGTFMIGWLEGPHPPAKLSVPEIQAIEKRYKALCKELKN